MTTPAAPGADKATDAMKALDAIKERIELTCRICCGLAPKQAVGELLDVTRSMVEWDTIRASLAAVPASEPVNIILHCPSCGLQHIDAPDERTTDWINPPHKSHLCHGCSHIWRPADVPTNGVAAIATKGSADSLAAAPAPVSGMPDLASLQRHNLVEHQHGSGHMVYWDKSMDEESDGEWVKFADVERLLNPAGETK